MINYLYIFILLTSVNIFANEQINYKFGYIDIDKILMNNKSYKKDFNRLENKLQKKRSELISIKEKILQLKKQLPLLNKKAQEGNKNKILILSKELQIKRNQFKDQINIDEYYLKEHYVRKVISYIDEFAIKNNFYLILDVRNTIFYKKINFIDISDEFSVSYNKKNP